MTNLQKLQEYVNTHDIEYIRKAFATLKAHDVRGFTTNDIAELYLEGVRPIPKTKIQLAVYLYDEIGDTEIPDLINQFASEFDIPKC